MKICVYLLYLGYTKFREGDESLEVILAIAGPIIAAAIVNELLSIFFKKFTAKLTPDERKRHITWKINIVITGIVLIVGFILFTLPVFGIRIFVIS